MEIIIYALAVYKITEMLLAYDGPLDIILLFRLAVTKLNKFIGKKLLNLDCFFCFSTVVTIPFAWYSADGWDAIINWFAISGLAWIIYSLMVKLDN